MAKWFEQNRNNKWQTIYWIHKNGYATTFTVTVAEPYKRWEFDMENSNMKGHWIGVFIDKGNETQIDFTENVIPKKWFMKPL